MVDPRQSRQEPECSRYPDPIRSSRSHHQHFEELGREGSLRCEPYFPLAYRDLWLTTSVCTVALLQERHPPLERNRILLLAFPTLLATRPRLPGRPDVGHPLCHPIHA